MSVQCSSTRRQETFLNAWQADCGGESWEWPDRVWENVWARKVAQTIRDTGGALVAFERVPHEAVQAARAWALDAGQG
jgi:hypothetical protein